MKKAFSMKQYEEYLNKQGNSQGLLEVIKSDFAGTNYRKHCLNDFKIEYQRALNNSETIKDVLSK